MLKENLTNALSKQFNFELYSAYIYLAMSAYCARNGLKGFANWLNVQAQEELAHAMHMYEYILERGASPVFEDVKKSPYDFKNIIGTKEASGSFDQFNQIMRDKPADFLLISGDDPIALPMLSIGAVGVISVLGNAYPQALSQMINLGLKGDYQKALSLHLNLLEITRLLFVEGNPVGIKSALSNLDICEAHLRLPLITPSADLNKQIKAEMERLKSLLS